MPSSSVPPPLLSPHGTLKGSLFQYAAPSANSLVAFESIHPRQEADQTELLPENKCILIGGLTDGLLSMPYTQALEKMCHSQPGDQQWSLVQPILSSSFTGFGHGSLEQDTRELGALLSYLQVHRNAKRVCFIGHSTGAQQVVHFLKHGDDDVARLIKGIVMQGGVSDREFGAFLYAAMVDENIALARRMKSQHRGNEMMPRRVLWAPITASRFLDMNDKPMDNDIFSSDLTDDELLQKLGHMGDCDGLKKVLVAFSGADQYVPGHVDKRLLVERLCRAMNQNKTNGVATPLFLETGNHQLIDCPDATALFLKEVEKVLSLVGEDGE